MQEEDICNYTIAEHLRRRAEEACKASRYYGKDVLIRGRHLRTPYGHAYETDATPEKSGVDAKESGKWDKYHRAENQASEER